MTPEEKLKRLLDIFDPDTLTKEEFVKSFENVVNLIKKIEKKNIEEFNAIREALTKFQDKLKNDTGQNVESLKSEVNKLVTEKLSNLTQEYENRMAAIDDKVLSVKDGQDADEEIIVNKVLSKIKVPTIDEIKNDLPIMSEQVRDALELLQGDERLTIEAISGLQEALEEIKGNKNKMIVAGARLQMVDDETPSGTVNGINTDFVLNLQPSPVSSLKVYVNGQRMRVTEDYTFSNKTISFLTAPPTGSIILCDYRI